MNEADPHQCIAECYAMPIAVPISPCASEESSVLDAATSVTGEFNEIERQYRIDSKVFGTGHHGSVRECTDRTTGQRYAVKSIRKSDQSIEPGILARETALLREMKHRSIIQLVDVCEDSEYLHVVTNLCAGGELFDKIVPRSSGNNDGPICLAEGEAARIMHEVLTAVSCMHKRGIVHRDLKPENILFETDDNASPIKIIDFGLARKHVEGADPPMTSIVGTPYYIAPEVLRKNYGKSCDLWSVGVISYMLLCGYPPFDGADKDETHRSVLSGQYHFPSKDWKSVSREAMDFIRRLLKMDPRKRMTAEEALDHPWLVRHNNHDCVMATSVGKSAEVIVKTSRFPGGGSIFRGGIAHRKIRMALFNVWQSKRMRISFKNICRHSKS